MLKKKKEDREVVKSGGFTLRIPVAKGAGGRVKLPKKKG